MSIRPVTFVIPSYDGSVAELFDELAKQTIAGARRVVIRGVSPAARARNAGAASVSDGAMLFLDDDVRLNSPQALEQMIAALDEVPEKDAVSLSWRLNEHATRLQRALWGDSGYTFDRNARRAELSWRECGAACFAVRAKRFRELGGFDESLVSAEDSDFAYRLTRDGGRIHTLPQYWIEHDPPRTLAAVVRKCVWYERGNAQMARKHPAAGHRALLDRPWKAVLYVLAHTIGLVPLMFFKITYRARRPRFSVRPLEALVSYVGAWAYSLEWLFLSNRTRKS